MKAYDVIIIGGGASGLLAAGTAADKGVSVLILEKMPLPGLKLRITGKGRCNLTNIHPLDEFIAHFGKNGKFLRPSFNSFFSDDLLRLLSGIGIKTVTERGGRVFSSGGKAQDVVNALIKLAKSKDAQIKINTQVTELIVENSAIAGAKTRHRKTGKEDVLTSRAVIIATGGASYSATGSTGDGYRLAEAVGHKIIPVRPSLVPLEVDGDIPIRLLGLTLKNVAASLYVDGRKKNELFGELEFTESGLTGPVILSLSKTAVDALNIGKKVSVSIDLKPALDQGKLEARLLRDISSLGNKNFKALLQGLLPSKLIPVCMQLTGIPPDKQVNQLTSDERKRLRNRLKDFRLEIAGYRPFEEAIITAGGVSLKEIDPNTLQSKLVEGLFFSGEVMDIDADTGGYNLQAAFSTGYLAGKAAAELV